MSDSIDALKRESSILKRLVGVSLTLNSTLELNLLLSHIITTAAALLDSHAASILLLDEESQQLYFVAATGADPRQLREIPVPIDSSIAGTVFRENRPMICDDVASDTRHYRPVSDATGISVRSLLGVPMRVKNRTTGVLEALNKWSGPFQQEDVQTLSTLASLAAVAIHNAQIHYDLERGYKDISDIIVSLQGRLKGK